MNKKQILIGFVIVAVIALVYFFTRGNDLEGKIAIPYIAHQAPVIDPHLPDANALSDKLDEVEFDGLFNVASNASGITYEDGLGTFLGIDENDVVSVQLRTDAKWSDSYKIIIDDDPQVKEAKADYFSAEDVAFTLHRIEFLGSLSPDYILVSQALKYIGFKGPDKNNVIRFQFKSDRIWTESDIKEVLSFKILPKSADMNALNYYVGSGPYLSVPKKEGAPDFIKNPERTAYINRILLKPFIDNSTFTTELVNNSVNVLLQTPFGSLSPVLEQKKEFFAKPSISTTFFAVLFNTQKLDAEQRKALRALLSNRKILNRFYKIGSKQQRNILNWKGEKNNYDELLNYSVFPSSSYYVEEEIVLPEKKTERANLQALPDTVKIAACVNFGLRAEYDELVEILNSPEISQGKIKAVAVSNADIKAQNYDAVLVAFTGYRSNFMFDAYDVFLRSPDLSVRKINLYVDDNGKILPKSLDGKNNFFGLNASKDADARKLLEYVYAFMSTREIGDKQAYAQLIDKTENEMALGKWLFSMPSLAYFSTQFDSSSINLYGVASQLSTIEKWKEKRK